MGSYYYFISSLPSLSLSSGDNLPSLEDFWTSTAGVIREKDRKMLYCVWQGKTPAQAPELILRWYRFENELKHALARHRSQELGRSTREVHASGAHAQVWQIIQGVWARTNPLDREIFLIEQVFLTLQQWASSVFPFSFQALVIYLLQLKLLYRRRSFEEKDGLVNFESIYSQVKDKILNNDGGGL